MNNNVKRITHGAVIAALYVVLTLFINAFNLANGAIQVRISEALTCLPVFTPAAIPGLFIGCLLSNIITGCALPDIIFGSIATLIGAVGTHFIAHKYWIKNKKLKFIAPIPPIIANSVIVPLILKYAYGLTGTYIFFAFTVFIGEVISCGIFGVILMSVLEKKISIFSEE